MDGTPHFSVTSAWGANISTPRDRGQPRTVYKYLGVYLFASSQTLNMIGFINNEITALFTATAYLGLTHSELTLRINAPSIPVDPRPHLQGDGTRHTPQYLLWISKTE